MPTSETEQQNRSQCRAHPNEEIADTSGLQVDDCGGFGANSLDLLECNTGKALDDRGVGSITKCDVSDPKQNDYQHRSHEPSPCGSHRERSPNTSRICHTSLPVTQASQDEHIEARTNRTSCLHEYRLRPTPPHASRRLVRPCGEAPVCVDYRMAVWWGKRPPFRTGAVDGGEYLQPVRSRCACGYGRSPHHLIRRAL